MVTRHDRLQGGAGALSPDESGNETHVVGQGGQDLRSEPGNSRQVKATETKVVVEPLTLEHSVPKRSLRFDCPLTTL